VWATVLLAFEIETGDSLEDLEPGVGVAADFDLRFDRSERVERLIEQVAHDAGLWLISSRADVTDGQVIVHAHMTLDKTRDVPMLGSPIVALQDEDVAARRGTAVAFATTLVVGMRQGRTDGIAQRRGISGLGGADAVCQTSFFHSASPRTA
jgi:hypothetical protein